MVLPQGRCYLRSGVLEPILFRACWGTDLNFTPPATEQAAATTTAPAVAPTRTGRTTRCTTAPIIEEEARARRWHRPGVRKQHAGDLRQPEAEPGVYRHVRSGSEFHTGAVAA